MSRHYANARQRITRNVAQDENGCWVWQRERNNQGYGRIELSGRPNRVRVLAHRYAYEAFRGPIPDGLGLDHLCRNPPCVNPDHLEPVTQRTNVLRSPVTLAAINARKTHCKWGHEFTEANTLLEHRRSGHARKCRACARRRLVEHYARRRAAA